MNFLVALAFVQIDRALQSEDDRNRRRPRRLADLREFAGAAQVEVEARAARLSIFSQARSETATIAKPGGAAKAFCEAAMTTSKPQSSIMNGVAPMPLTLSTITSAGCLPIAVARACISLATPVDVSLCVSRMALISQFVSARKRSARAR